jgi:tetratricopeptide (TPR) repeat protein
VALGLALVSVTLLSGLVSASAPSGGDAVDEAYAAGTRAAAEGNWAGAASAWEEARSILPESSAQLSYDLGTAYAHLGALGHATIHLERARRADAGLAEDARRNLAIVRRQAEISAAGNSRELSELPGWKDRLFSALASSFFAWLALVSGWSAFLAWALRSRVSASTRGASGLGALVLVGVLVFVVSATGHAFARDSAVVAHEMIVLRPGLEAREGPGLHQNAAFELEASSRLFEEERRSGWVMVRLPGGLAGWVEEAGVVRVDALEGAIAALPQSREEPE